VANFPVLKTGAIAQYPADKVRRYSTDVYRFVDGSEQRFPQYGTALRRWSIALELLDEQELTGLESFFLSVGGRAGNFSFTDPWDGTVYPNCSFENDVFEARFESLGNSTAAVVVRENR
jgi:hypothetical protein